MTFPSYVRQKRGNLAKMNPLRSTLETRKKLLSGQTFFSKNLTCHSTFSKGR